MVAYNAPAGIRCNACGTSLPTLTAPCRCKSVVTALVEVKTETERGIVVALATGRVPSPLIVDRDED